MSTSTTQAINFAAKLALFDDRWQPRVIAQMNDYQFKLVKIEGDFVWHSHADTDETFIVLAGRLRIDFRDGAVHLGPGEMYVVPRGVGTSRSPRARCACSWWSPAACATPATRAASGRPSTICGSERISSVLWRQCIFAPP